MGVRLEGQSLKYKTKWGEREFLGSEAQFETDRYGERFFRGEGLGM